MQDQQRVNAGSNACGNSLGKLFTKTVRPETPDSVGDEEEDETSFIDSLGGLDEVLNGLSDEDFLELLKPNDHLDGFVVTWQQCGVLHKVGNVEIQETRTFAYDDYILGNTVKSTCRLKDFRFLDKTALSVGARELDFEISGVGFRVWDAAVVLTAWLHDHVDLFKHKKCIEIGAGCGLPGMYTLEHADSVVLSDKEEALLDNLLTGVVMNHGEEIISEFFPTKMTIPEASLRTTFALKPRISFVCEDGAKASLCSVDYDRVLNTIDFESPFEFLCGTDLTYTEKLGKDVALTVNKLLMSFGEGVIVSPEERVGNITCITTLMKLGVVVGIEFLEHIRHMTPEHLARKLLGRCPRHSSRIHLLIRFRKFDAKLALSLKSSEA